MRTTNNSFLYLFFRQLFWRFGRFRSTLDSSEESFDFGWNRTRVSTNTRETIERLLAQGADVEEKDESGLTILQYVVANPSKHSLDKIQILD